MAESKLGRCIQILLALQHRSELANRHVRELNQCDEQTALRDLHSLMEAGVPLEPCGTGPNTTYTISRQWQHAGLHFSMGDAMALHFGRQLLDFLEGTTIPEWLDDLRRKLGVGADARTIDREHRLAERLLYVTEPYRPYQAHDASLNTILTAVIQDEELQAEYQSRSGQRSFRLWPLALVIYRRALYLLARDVERERMLRLPVERFISVRRGEAFIWPERPSLAELKAFVDRTYGIVDFGNDPEEVRLRFQPAVVDLARARRWHPTQRFEDGPDGTVDLVMHTSGPELASMAMEWGHQVEVIAPPALRERVRRELTAALRRYES